MTPLELVLSKLPSARKSGTGFMAKCPAHDDQRDSLSVSQGDGGLALVHCHSGCTPEAVCKAMGLRLADLMPTEDRKHKSKTSHGPIVARYRYRRADGTIGWQKNRHADKSMWWQHVVGQSYRTGYGDEKPLLYNLDKIVRADATAPICLTEGEKDADVLGEHGHIATSLPVTGKLYEGAHDFLRDRDLILFEDNDAKARKAVAGLVVELFTVAKSIRVIRFGDIDSAGKGYDVSDYLASHSPGELAELIDAAAPVTAEVVQEDREKIKSFKREGGHAEVDGEDEKQSTADRLVDLAYQCFRFVRNAQNETFAVH